MKKINFSKTILSLVFILLIKCFCYAQTIKTLEVLTKQKPIPYITDKFEIVDYILLQTSPECIVSNIWALKIRDDKIFTFNNRSVFVWNKSGEFIRKIGKQGNGPGEMLMPTDFAISPDGNTIAIWDNYRETMNKYDLMGKHLWSKKMGPRQVCNFCWAKSGQFILYSNYATLTTKECSFYLMDQFGDNIKQLLPFEKDEYGDSYMSYYNFPTYGSLQYAQKNLDNLVYSLNIKDELKPCYKVEFDCGNLEKDKFKKYMYDPHSLFEAVKNDESAYVIIFHENDKFYAITYNKGNERSTNILLKNNNGQFLIKHNPRNFDPLGEIIPIFNNDTIILIVEPYKLKASLKNMLPAVKAQMGQSFATLEKIAKETSEEDNPVLLILKMKE